MENGEYLRSSEIDEEQDCGQRGVCEENIHMCQENSFHSIRFSTDDGSYPSDLSIIAYLEQDDVGETEPFCKILFYMNDHSGEHDIREAADVSHLFLDGKEIAFY